MADGKKLGRKKDENNSAKKLAELLEGILERAKGELKNKSARSLFSDGEEHKGVIAATRAAKDLGLKMEKRNGSLFVGGEKTDKKELKEKLKKVVQEALKGADSDETIMIGMPDGRMVKATQFLENIDEEVEKSMRNVSKERRKSDKFAGVQDETMERFEKRPSDFFQAYTSKILLTVAGFYSGKIEMEHIQQLAGMGLVLMTHMRNELLDKTEEDELMKIISTLRKVAKVDLDEDMLYVQEYTPLGSDSHTAFLTISVPKKDSAKAIQTMIDEAPGMDERDALKKALRYFEGRRQQILN